MDLVHDREDAGLRRLLLEELACANGDGGGLRAVTEAVDDGDEGEVALAADDHGVAADVLAVTRQDSVIDGS
jgi:hypothetical protein